MFGPIRNVVFDFDGTLVDTMPSVVKGLHQAILVATGKDIPTDELVKTFGPAPQDVLARWMDAEKIPVAVKAWLDFEAQTSASDMLPFEGVAAMLEGLKSENIRIGIFTGRDRAGTLRIARSHGWLGQYFTEAEVVCGDDGMKCKPDPECLLHLMAKMKLDPAGTVMVGDHPFDAMAGRAAGVKAAAALWDLPPGPESQKIKFKNLWTKWDALDCDVRLVSPLSLLEWVNSQKVAQRV